ncbi:site-2 protease family protein, partial [Stenotrophomonas sp. 3diitr2024]|uniref:site-2 protease family protein n=1 Tax=Stenotrophomonas sp. 3diitr2024 TaxID=3345115 RepID=UPI0035CC395B
MTVSAYGNASTPLNQVASISNADAHSLLVTFHEFGHYWVGRLCGVKILRFSVGFGRPLWSPQPISWAGERQVLCGVQAPLQAFNARGEGTPLIVDGATSDLRCVRP